jgi:hypothetical protein
MAPLSKYCYRNGCDQRPDTKSNTGCCRGCFLVITRRSRSPGKFKKRCSSKNCSVVIDQKSKTGLCRGCYLAQLKIKRSMSSILQCRNDNCSRLVDPKLKIDLCKQCLAIVVNKNQKAKGGECYPKICCACCISFSDRTTIILVAKVIESSNIFLLGMSYTDRKKAIENDLGKRNYTKKERREKRHDERELKRLATPNLYQIRLSLLKENSLLK